MICPKCEASLEDIIDTEETETQEVRCPECNRELVVEYNDIVVVVKVKSYPDSAYLVECPECANGIVYTTDDDGKEIEEECFKCRGEGNYFEDED